MIPIFPELRPYLEAVWDEAEAGTEFLITRCRDSNTNLRTRVTRFIRQASLKPWPKLFQNLRSTRATELAQQYPIHVVCEWIGNSQPVAMKHYLQVTEEHFEHALRGDETDNAECNALGAEKATQNTTFNEFGVLAVGVRW